MNLSEALHITPSGDGVFLLNKNGQWRVDTEYFPRSNWKLVAGRNKRLFNGYWTDWILSRVGEDVLIEGVDLITIEDAKLLTASRRYMVLCYMGEMIHEDYEDKDAMVTSPLWSIVGFEDTYTRAMDMAWEGDNQFVMEDRPREAGWTVGITHTVLSPVVREV